VQQELALSGDTVLVREIEVLDVLLDEALVLVFAPATTVRSSVFG